MGVKTIKPGDNDWNKEIESLKQRLPGHLRRELEAQVQMIKVDKTGEVPVYHLLGQETIMCTLPAARPSRLSDLTNHATYTAGMASRLASQHRLFQTFEMFESVCHIMMSITSTQLLQVADRPSTQ